MREPRWGRSSASTDLPDSARGLTRTMAASVRGAEDGKGGEVDGRGWVASPSSSRPASSSSAETDAASLPVVVCSALCAGCLSSSVTPVGDCGACCGCAGGGGGSTCVRMGLRAGSCGLAATAVAARGVASRCRSRGVEGSTFSMPCWSLFTLLSQRSLRHGVPVRGQWHRVSCPAVGDIRSRARWRCWGTVQLQETRGRAPSPRRHWGCWPIGAQVVGPMAFQ